MDHSGPLYTVRMRRGQGYNSYIQEPRIDNAVTITTIADERPTSSMGSMNGEPEISPMAAVVAVPSPPATSQPLMDLFAAAVERAKPSESKATSDPKPRPYLIKLDPNSRNSQTVTFSSKQVKTKLELDKAMGLKASAAIKATSLGPTAEAGSNLATQDDMNANDVNFLVHVKVVNEVVQPREEWTFNEVTSLRQILEDKAVADSDHRKSVEFTRIYGDTFISDFVLGGEIYAWIGLKSQDRNTVKELGAEASARLTPMTIPVQASAEASFTQKSSSAFSRATTSIRIQWRGGGEIKNHDFPWDIDNLVSIANAFPSMVALKPAKIRAVLTPYTALKSFHDHRRDNPHVPLPLSYDHCAIYTSTLYDDFVTFQDLCGTLNEMIKNPGNYTRRQEKTRQARTSNQDANQSTAPTLTSTSLNGGNEPAAKSAAAKTEEGATDNFNQQYKSLTDLKAILNASYPETGNMDPDPHRLSLMRLLCRNAMIYIQEQAAELVIDPDKSITKSLNGQPHFALPQYICPGVIKNVLPVSKYGDFKRFMEIYDFDEIPPSFIESSELFWWDVIGDTLSIYKKYEYFAMGNFDVENEELPEAVTANGFSSRWWKHFSKPIKDSKNAISGLGMQYGHRPSWVPDKVRKEEDEAHDQMTPTTTQAQQQKVEKDTKPWQTFAGSKPAEVDWKKIEERGGDKNSPAINIVVGYWQPGSGRIAGIDLSSTPDDEGDVTATSANNMANTAADGSNNKKPEPAFSYRSWDTRGLDTQEPYEVMAKVSRPGGEELEDEDRDKKWIFAGFLGAFEKVGPLKTGRVLARLAVVWKRRPSSV